MLLQPEILALLFRLLLETTLLSFVGTDVLVPKSFAEGGEDLILNIRDGLFELLDGGACPFQLALLLLVLGLVLPELSLCVVELLLLALEVLVKRGQFALLEPETLLQRADLVLQSLFGSASPPGPG